MPPRTSPEQAKPLDTRAILDGAVDGRVITAEEALHLLKLTRDEDVRQLREAADEVRKRQAGDAVSFTTGCSLFLTNLDELQPTVYSYSRKPGDNGAFTLSIDGIDAVLETAGYRQTREVYLSGGGFWPHLLIPGLEAPNVLKTYARLLAYIRERLPQIRIIGFSPDEIDFLHVVSDRSEAYILELFKDQGLEALGGHQVGILSNAVRRKISPRLTTVKHWLEIAESARQLGLPVTLKLEAGHYETLRDRVTHMAVLRNYITGLGRTSPESLLPDAFPVFMPQMWTRQTLRNVSTVNRRNETLGTARRNAAHDTSAQDESLGASHIGLQDRQKLLAVTRLLLGDTLSHQQVFQLPEGISEAQEGLTWGASIFGPTDATAFQEFLSGSRHSTSLSAPETEALIRETGRTPVLR